MRIEAAGHAAQLRGGHAHHRTPSPPSPSRPSSERREAPRGPAARNDIQSRYQARGAGGGGMRGSLLGRFLPLDVDEELDLPAEVLERVANREAEWLSHAYTEAHASVLIEAAARGWHGRRKAARQGAAAAAPASIAGRLRGRVLERRRRRPSCARRALQRTLAPPPSSRRARQFGQPRARANVANATVAAAVGAPSSSTERWRSNTSRGATAIAAARRRARAPARRRRRARRAEARGVEAAARADAARQGHRLAALAVQKGGERRLRDGRVVAALAALDGVERERWQRALRERRRAEELDGGADPRDREGVEQRGVDRRREPGGAAGAAEPGGRGRPAIDGAVVYRAPLERPSE